MEGVEEDREWSLFCPNKAPGLHEVWGEKFEALFIKYEKEGRAKKTVKAQELGMLKDATNRESLDLHTPKSKLKHLYRQIEPAEPRYDKVVQSVHGDHRVLRTRQDRRV